MTEIDYRSVVHTNDNYAVQVVKMPDMAFSTYAVINRETGVIEQLQPNLYNAKYIATQFDKWLTSGPDDDDNIEAILTAFGSSGKAN